MNCFDCAVLDTITTAVAICHDCGAGVCAQHATISETITRALNMAVPVEPPQRRIQCSVCADATAAHHRRGT